MYPRPSFGFFLRRLINPASGPLGPLQLIVSLIGAMIGALVGVLVYFVAKGVWRGVTKLLQRRRKHPHNR